LAAQSNSYTKSSYGSTDSSRLVEFVDDLVSSVEWPIYFIPSDLRETLTSLHATSQQALQELLPGARNELLISLCALYGYRVSGQTEFANWTCPVVSVELPLGLVVRGALVDTQSRQFKGQEVVKAISSIANEAPFVLVLDCADELRRERPTQDNVRVVSMGYLTNLVAGALAIHYWERIHQEIPNRDAVRQFKSFLDELEVSWGTAQLIAGRLGIG